MMNNISCAVHSGWDTQLEKDKKINENILCGRKRDKWDSSGEGVVLLCSHFLQHCATEDEHDDIVFKVM